MVKDWLGPRWALAQWHTDNWLKIDFRSASENRSIWNAGPHRLHANGNRRYLIKRQVEFCWHKNYVRRRMKTQYTNTARANKAAERWIESENKTKQKTIKREQGVAPRTEKCRTTFERPTNSKNMPICLRRSHATDRAPRSSSVVHTNLFLCLELKNLSIFTMHGARWSLWIYICELLSCVHRRHEVWCLSVRILFCLIPSAIYL